jgi:O-antigen/teichoic acid export membrane protein
MIRRTIARIRNDELIRGSFILLVAIGFFNILGFVFHTILARIMTPEEYGIFAAVMALVFIYGIPSEAIQTWMSRITSRTPEKNRGNLRNLLYKSIKKYFLIGLAIFAAISILSVTLLSRILEIQSGLLILTSTMLIILFLIPLTRGIMQGAKEFGMLGINMTWEAVLKVAFAVALVIAGFGVMGAIGGVVLSLIVTLVVSIRPLRKIFGKGKEEGEVRNDKSMKENMPIWIIISTILIFFSLDILIAKSIFTQGEAGQYAVISIIGKIIFFASNSVSKAMFPISSQNFAAAKKDLGVLKKSLLMTLAIIITSTIAIIIFPKGIIWLLFGNNYVASHPLLLPTALSFALLSITNLFLLHAISFNLTSRASYILWIFPILQLIILPSAKTLTQFVTILLILNTLLLIASLTLWAVKALRKKEN